MVGESQPQDFFHLVIILISVLSQKNYCVLCYLLHFNFCRSNWSWQSLPLLNSLESLYIVGLIPLEVWNSAIFPFLDFSEKFPFLPLTLTSVYCSFGIIYSWIKFYKITLFDKKLKSQ